MPASSAKWCNSSRLWSLTRCDHLRPRCHQRGSSINKAIAPYDHIVTAPEVEVRSAWQHVAGAGHDELLQRFLVHLREPHRHYHTPTHVMWVVRHLDALTDALRDDVASAGVDLRALRWAALYHDAIYDPRAGDNEARSAELAVRHASELGWEPARHTVVHRLILATAGHRAHTLDEAILVDADLAILGADANDYEAYVHGVRGEYVHVDDAGWRQGRSDVLRRLLGADPLFSTEPMRAARESRARANMTAELASLR